MVRSERTSCTALRRHSATTIGTFRHAPFGPLLLTASLTFVKHDKGLIVARNPVISHAYDLLGRVADRQVTGLLVSRFSVFQGRARLVCLGHRLRRFNLRRRRGTQLRLLPVQRSREQSPRLRLVPNFGLDTARGHRSFERADPRGALAAVLRTRSRFLSLLVLKQSKLWLVGP